ncbi:MAG: hypothetical protein ACSHYF_11195 [Verrucomicrobiaceae bacterium]
MRLLVLLLTLQLPLLALSHPADLNQDQRITATELANALSLITDPASKNNGLDDPDFAQAWFIWRSGETYLENTQLPQPHNWLPSPPAGNDYLSLTTRACLPLEDVEIIGLSNPNGTLTARFRPLHTQEWLSLDIDTGNNSFSFLAPYVPSPWLPTRDIEIEVSDSSQTWRLGHLRLLPIDRSQINLPAFMESTAAAIANHGQWNPDTTVQNLSTGAATSTFEKLMGYHYAYLKHSAETIRRLKNAPATADTELEILIAEELFALYSGKANLPDPLSPQPVATRNTRSTRNSSDCVTINNWVDLIDFTIHRAKLEAAENDESLAKKAQDKALEKLQEGAEKLGERLASDSKLLAKRAGLAITIPLELHSLLSEWDKKMLPKTFTRLTYDLRDGNSNPLPQPMPTDSPHLSGECGIACFANFKASITSDSFSMAKYLLDNKVPGPDDLKGLAEGNKGKVADALVDYYSSDLGKARQAAIDGTYNQIKGLDYSPPSCTWSDIPVPNDNDDPKVILTSKLGRFALYEGLKHCFEPVTPGRDLIELKIKTTTSLNFGDNNLPNTPPFKQDAVLLSDHPRLSFQPPTYSLDDFDDPPKLTVDISSSYENKDLKWSIYDKEGKKVYQEITNVNSPFRSTESTHDLENYPVPTDHEKYPLLVIAESQAMGCLEANSYPAVSESATIFYRAKVFDLDPTKICRDPGETISITAFPHKPDPDFKVETWEIIRGGGTLTPTGDTTATLTLPDEPEAEITVRATGEDDFVAQGYYTTGPCLKFVQAAETYQLNPSTLAEGMLFPTKTFSFNAGYGDFQPSDLNSPITVNGTTIDGTPLITGLGQLITSFDKEVADSRPDSRTFETSSSGVALALLDFQNPTQPIVERTAAQIGGDYFSDEQLAGDPRDSAWLPHFGKGNGDPVVEIITVSPDIYQIHFEYSLTKDDNTDESGLAITWLSGRGEVIDTFGPTIHPEDDETILYAATVEYPRTEARPDLNFTVSGTIVYPQDTEDPNRTLYSSVTAVYQKVDINHHSTVRIPTVEDDLIICTPLGSAPRSSPFEFYNHCCGGISLRDYELIRGSALQQSIFTAYTNIENLGLALSVIHNYNDDKSLLYCDEQKKKREDHPVPPEDLPKPPDDPDPEPGETPEEIGNYFTNSPADLNGPGNFPPPATPLPSTTTSGGVFTGPTILYPFDRTDFSTFTTELQLGTFTAGGALQSMTLWLDEDTRSALADTLTPVLYGRLSPTGASGLFVQREFNGNNYFEFWERDAANNKFIARTLITLTSGQHVIGLGDFDQDGLLDYAGRDSNANLITWKGTATGPSATATIHLATQGNWIPRAAAVNPDGSTTLLSEDPFTSTYRHQILNSAAAITTDLTPERPDGRSTMSLADFNADGWPDLVFHSSGMQDFLVHFTAANATTTGNQTYSLSNDGSFSLISLPQSLRD